MLHSAAYLHPSADRALWRPRASRLEVVRCTRPPRRGQATHAVFSRVGSCKLWRRRRQPFA